MQNTYSRKCNVLIGCTGSVASIKIPQIVKELTAFEHLVCIELLLHNFTDYFLMLFVIPTVLVACAKEQGRRQVYLHLGVRQS